MIKDPANGNSAAVNDNRQVYAYAESVSDIDTAIRGGRAFFANTSIINLTSASASGILHIANDGDVPIELVEVLVTLGPSTGGAGGRVLLSGSRNDAGGTVVSAGADVSNSCQNFGISDTANVTIKSGSEGSTIGSSPNSGVLVTDQAIFNTAASRIYLPKGAAYALQVTPPTGNTSLDVTVRILMVEVDTGGL